MTRGAMLDELFREEWKAELDDASGLAMMYRINPRAWEQRTLLLAQRRRLFAAMTGSQSRPAGAL